MKFDSGRNVDAARKDEVERAEHHLAGSRFRNEAERTEVEGFYDPVAILVADIARKALIRRLFGS
jgi:hypothetical protein